MPLMLHRAAFVYQILNQSIYVLNIIKSFRNYLAKAFFNNIPDNDDKPPTIPPIKAVKNNNSAQWGRWNIMAIRLARILLLGILLNKANTAHAIKTPPKPDKKDCPDVFPIKKAAKNAMTATIHHGKK